MTINEYIDMAQAERIALICALTADSVSHEDFFISALNREDDALPQWYLIKALGCRKSLTSIPLILRFCQAPDVDFGSTSLHAICAWTLGQIGDASFEPTSALIRAKDLSTRKCIVDALGEIGDPRGIEMLGFALEHDLYPVKLIAGMSLAKIGDKAVPVIGRVLHNADRKTQIIALDAISKINSDRSLTILDTVLQEGSVEDKKIILRTRQPWNRTLMSRIQGLANDSDTELSALARFVLREEVASSS